MRDLLSLNRSYLLQADALLALLDETSFTCPHEDCHGASLGQHIRHCVEHYSCLLSQLNEARIDYDLRPRNPEIESSPEAARKAIGSTLALLSEAAENWTESMPVLVHMDCGNGECNDDSDASWQTSSVGRELQSLVSHTVHHFAVISIMCQRMGIPLPTDFGVAPSTLNHWEKNKQSSLATR